MRCWSWLGAAVIVLTLARNVGAQSVEIPPVAVVGPGIDDVRPLRSTVPAGLQDSRTTVSLRLLDRPDDEVAPPPGGATLAVSGESQRLTGLAMTRFSIVGLAFGGAILTLSGLLYFSADFRSLLHGPSPDRTVPDITATVALGVLASNVVGLCVGLGLRSTQPHAAPRHQAFTTLLVPAVSIAPDRHGGATLILGVRF